MDGSDARCGNDLPSRSWVFTHEVDCKLSPIKNGFIVDISAICIGCWWDSRFEVLSKERNE